MTLPENEGRLFSRTIPDEDRLPLTMPHPSVPYNPPLQMPIPYKSALPPFQSPNNFTEQCVNTTYGNPNYSHFDSNNSQTFSFPEPSQYYRPNTESSTHFPEIPFYNQSHSSSITFPEPDFGSSFPSTGSFGYTPNISGPLFQSPEIVPGFPVPATYLDSNEYDTKPVENSDIPDAYTYNNCTDTKVIVPVTDNLYPPLFSGYPPAKPSQIYALSNLTGINSSTQFEWVNSVNGYIPPEAAGCGKENNGAPLYVSRTVYKQTTHVGMVGPHLKGISFIHNGSVVKQKTCSILCGDIRKLRWIKCMGPFKVDGQKLVQAGTTVAGKPIFIGIVDYRGGIYIGEVGEHIEGGICFVYNGKKHTAPDFYYLLAYNF
ncbi:hypothetical protein K7432_011033 [Basidiobolus ranarum]|uniref:Uncharacterized protein n=1 Tax=Basidiobolus ranarum TaxID=34480 RepID=A0ABR2VUI9_9FUNG